MLGLFCKADGEPVYGLMDACRFVVEDDDFFGNSRRIPMHLLGNAMLCDHKWEVKYNGLNCTKNI